MSSSAIRIVVVAQFIEPKMPDKSGNYLIKTI
jgi:hypothetical protein